VAALAVRPRPRVGLLISGDELVPAGEPRGPGRVWESNGTLLEALLARLGFPVAERWVVADQPAELERVLDDLAERCDVVVSTGGVSSGDADWIRPLVARRGHVTFWKLFLKPGRPFAFGQLGGKPFFGLPGNPVAAAITALQLLWPALQALEGSEPQLPLRIRVRLETPMRRAAGRPELARAQLVVGEGGELVARIEGSQASSRIGSLRGADLLLEIPAEETSLEAGQWLWAQLLRLPLGRVARHPGAKPFAPFPFPKRGVVLEGLQQLPRAALGRTAPVGQHSHHHNGLPRDHPTHPVRHPHGHHPMALGAGPGQLQQLRLTHAGVVLQFQGLQRQARRRGAAHAADEEAGGGGGGIGGEREEGLPLLHQRQGGEGVGMQAHLHARLGGSTDPREARVSHRRSAGETPAHPHRPGAYRLGKTAG